MNTRYYIFLFCLIMASCSGLISTGGSDLAYLYSPQTTRVQPVFSYIHEDLQVTRLKVSLLADDLLYIRDAREEYYLSRFAISITVLAYPGQKRPIYTSTLEFTDTLLLQPGRLLEQEMTFPLNTGNKYWLYLGFNDKNRREAYSSLVFIDKESIYSRGFFNIVNHMGDTILFHPFGFLNAEEKITLKPVNSETERIEINHYSSADNFPAVPFRVIEEENIETDDLSPTFTTIAYLGEQSFRIDLPESGVYRINEPGNLQNGFSIVNFWEGFPLMPKDQRYLHPLRYISTTPEFERMLQLDDPQLAAERFWIRNTGNPDRAAAVRNRYLNRVVRTNELFTSHIPGWKTDRGMIYIIFGPPDKVFHNREGETWIYDQTMQTPYTELFFRRTENILSHNHLELVRDTTYERFWNIAVETWRR